MNLTWPLALVIIAVVAFVAWIITLEYKRAETQDQKRFRNPLFITIIVTGLIILVVLIMEAFDVLPAGWAKEHWWTFLILLIGIWYFNYQAIAKLKPLPMPKLEREMWDLIFSRNRARPHRGLGFGTPLPYHNVTSTKENGIYNKVVNFLARTTLLGGQFILVRLDIGNSYPLGYIENPDTQYVKRLFGKEVAQQYDIERELLKKSIEPDEYSVKNDNEQQEAAEASI